MRSINKRLCKEDRLGFYDVRKNKAKLRLICKERLSPSCVRGRPLQLCAQRDFVRRLRKYLQLCAQRPAAVCTAFKA